MAKKIKVVVINGPPGSGKDTLANALLHDVDLRRNNVMQLERFSRPLKRALCAFFGYNISGIDDYSSLEIDKNEDKLYGQSYRNLQIALSETLAKPKLGEDIFGKLLVERVERAYKLAIEKHKWALADDQYVVVIPDSGFLVELRPVVAHFGYPNVCVVKLFRSTANYSKDSRGYLPTSALLDLGVKQIILRNDGTESQFRAEGVKEVSKWL